MMGWLRIALACGAILAAGWGARAQLGLGMSPGEFAVRKPDAGQSIPTTPCVGGQLDFSDPTGCNLTLYMVGLR